MLVKYLFFLIFLLITTFTLFSAPIEFKNSDQKLIIGDSLEILEDTMSNMTPEEAIKSNRYIKSTKTVPNLGLSNSTFWIKFTISNHSGSSLVLSILQPNIDQIEIYSFSNNILSFQKAGQIYPFDQRKYKTLDYIFDLKPDNKTIYLLKVRSSEQLLVPIQISTKEVALKLSFTKEIIFSVYTGIIIAMIFYNIFIFVSINNRSYIYYVLYIISVALTQTTFQGFAFKYFWPGSSFLAIQSTFITPALVGITTIPFFIVFVETKKYLGHFHYCLYFIVALYLVGIISSLYEYYFISYKIVEIGGIIFCLTLLFLSAIIALKGSRQAKFFLIAWSIFLTGVLIYALKDLGILPYNDFTNYTMPAGAAIEVILLSLALADRINILRKENTLKQSEIIRHLHENETSLLLWKEAVLNFEKLKKESFRNQVNPHFLFNSLNVLTELLYENQEQAAKFVNQLAQVYRYVLEHKDKEVVKVETELKFIEAFIFLLKIRFDKNLLIENNIQTIENAMIPPLTLQLLIENAIKHNIVSEEYPLSIEISLWDDYITVKNIVKMKAFSDRSTGIGLKNIEERYKFLSDKKVIIESEENLFIVKVPLLHVL